MDWNLTRINWVGNIYQKLEAVCQEVDHVVGQDAMKYLENRVQNVGDGMKKVYSGVVHELLPHSVALTNNLVSSVMPVAGAKDCIESLQDSNAIDIANDPHASAPIKDDLENQVNDETCSEFGEMEDSYVTQERVCDDSGVTFGTEKENLHAITEDVAVESAPELLNSISVEEEEPLEFSVNLESYSGLSDSGCGVLVRTMDNTDVNVEQGSCLIVEENAMNSSISEVLNFVSDADKDTPDISAEVSLAASSVSYEMPNAEIGSLCFGSSFASNSLHSESLESYSFQIESSKSNSGDAARCISDSSMDHVCCEEPSSDVAGQIMEPRERPFSSGHCQSVESNDESLVSSIEGLENIQLNVAAKLGESCVFVDDSELYAVSYRAQKLRSYKKRIQDAFAPKKRLAKAYEQLAIWYGDTDLEHSQGSSRTLLPFSSRTNVESKNLQLQHVSETEWELL